MANQKQRLVDEVNFVFDECARFQKQMRSGQHIEPNSPEAMELFCTIPHPKVSSSFQVCGRKAYGALDRLALLAVTNAGINETVAIDSVRKELSAILVQKFQIERLPLELRNVERAMSQAAKRAASKRRDITHFLACHLMLAKDPSKFDMGPVTFHTQRSFRSSVAATISAERRELKRDRKLIRQALEYYQSFGWVAEVHIASCDKKTSQNVAENTVSAALDCLHLLLGYKHTQRMMIEGPATRTDRRARITRNEKSLSYSVSYGGPGAVGFPDDWFEQFYQPGWDTALKMFGLSLETICRPQLERPLSRRFLDAAKWFGEAVRERSPAAKVIKYTTALERMLMTDERDDIAELVSDRAAALCCTLPSKTSFESWKADTKRAYAIRSKLVHGSMSPTSQDVYEGVRLASMISESAIHAAVAGYGTAGLTAQQASTKRLARWYNDRVKHVKSIIQ